jgi:hypothetical protein
MMEYSILTNILSHKRFNARKNRTSNMSRYLQKMYLAKHRYIINLIDIKRD